MLFYSASPVDDEIFGGPGWRSESLSARSRNEHEFLVPRRHDPCGKREFGDAVPCNDRTRYVRHVPTNSGKILVCGRGHKHEHNGKKFIPAHEFAEGGDLVGVLPPHLCPEATLVKKSRWKVSSETAKRISKEQTCANCETPSFNWYENSDVADLYLWLREHDQDLFETVQDSLRNKPGIEFKDWYFHLDIPIRMRIGKRLDMSLLSDEHGVARKIGDQIWSRISRSAQTLLQTALVFRFCRLCNLSKGAKKLPQHRLVEIYVKYNYGGSLAFAKADVKRWNALEEILAIIYAEAAS